MLEIRLKWFEHLEKILVDVVVWRIYHMKESQSEEIEKDLEKLQQKILGISFNKNILGKI
jgi:hypothetical protein